MRITSLGCLWRVEPVPGFILFFKFIFFNELQGHSVPEQRVFSRIWGLFIQDTGEDLFTWAPRELLVAAQKWCVQGWEEAAPKREQAWRLLKCKLGVQDNQKTLLFREKVLTSRRRQAILHYVRKYFEGKLIHPSPSVWTTPKQASFPTRPLKMSLQVQREGCRGRGSEGCFHFLPTLYIMSTHNFICQFKKLIHFQRSFCSPLQTGKEIIWNNFRNCFFFLICTMTRKVTIEVML